MRTSVLTIFFLTLSFPLFGGEVARVSDSPASPPSIEIRNRSIKVIIEKAGDSFQEVYFARKGSSWVEMLRSGSPLRPEPALNQNDEHLRVYFTKSERVNGDSNTQSVELTASINGGDIVKTVTLAPDEPFVRIGLRYKIHGVVRLQSLWSTYSFGPDHKPYSEFGPLDFVFTPQLRPEQEQIIADHTFRSPALMMQKNGYFVALVPVLQELDGKNRSMRTAADLEVETADRPFFSLGLENWIPEPYKLRKTHVFYAAPDSLAATLQDTTVSLGYLLFLRSDAPRREGFRDIVRYHWATSGARCMQRAKGPQAEPFASYIQKAWYQFLPQIALDTQYQGAQVTLLRQARLAWSNNLPGSADNDCWFNVWFNSLRTSYGMYFYGRSAGDRHLMRDATRVLNLALLAPQKNGIAPTIFYIDSLGSHWVADHGWGGIDEGRDLPMFHNAWTCYWLLQWMDLVPERKTEILKYTRAFADFLLSNQHASGVIPSWYDPETLKPVETFRAENAETAGAGLFLAEFYARTREIQYLEASERAMQYIFTSILPQRKWFDFETFFSCSRKPLGFFDSYTQQNPQNTLSIHQAAEACYELFKLTGKNEYRDRGLEIIDYLCLFQQVWSPQWLSCELFGGFGVQNTDAEWSDSRQGYFAVTLMKYYELTGKKEYFERGVASLRAMFSLFESPTSPRTAENYAHSGYDRPAGVTGIHWGTGSSVVSVHLITSQYGDAYVDVKGVWGVGIDGCRIPEVKITGSSIMVQVLDNLSKSRTIRLKFGHAARAGYDIVINTKKYGRISAEAMKEGIDVTL